MVDVDCRLSTSMIDEDIDALSADKSNSHTLLSWITSGALCAMCVQVGVTISVILLGEVKPHEQQWGEVEDEVEATDVSMGVEEEFPLRIAEATIG